MSNLVITYSKRRRKRHRNDGGKQEEGPKVKVAKKVCMFCSQAEDNELDFGKIFEKNDITVHYFCMLLSSGLCQNGAETRGILGFLLQDIKKEILRGSRLRCCFCREKGATIGCCLLSCRKVFHLGCGRQNGTLHQFFGEFRSYCDVHWPKQLLPSVTDSGVKRKSKGACLICLAKVDTRMFWDFVQSPCCENVFHRRCLQQYALSAGLHYFKCPLCNSTKDFQKHTLQMGIYIPDQDAAWEKEANAFEELLERHNSCNADSCSCYWGRQHDADTGPFELLLCECCGSYGSHRACKGLLRSGTLLVCPECAKITEAMEKKRQESDTQEAAPALTQSSSSLHDRDCRSSNSQASLPSTSDTAFKNEDIVVISKDDIDDFVDILSCDNDDDISLSSHVNSRFVNCKVILERIDLKYSLQSGSLNLKNLHNGKSIGNRFINDEKSTASKNLDIIQRGGCTSTDNLESVNFRNSSRVVSKRRKLGSALKDKSHKLKLKLVSKDKSQKKKAKLTVMGNPRKAKAHEGIPEKMELNKNLTSPGTSKAGEPRQFGFFSGNKGANALKTGHKKKKFKNKCKFKSMWGQKTIDHYFSKVTDEAAEIKDNLALGEIKGETLENNDKSSMLWESEMSAYKRENILKESFDSNSQSAVQATTSATQGGKKDSMPLTKPEESSLEKNVPSSLNIGAASCQNYDESEEPFSMYSQSLHKYAVGEKTMSKSKDVVYVRQFGEAEEQNCDEILSKNDVTD